MQEQQTLSVPAKCPRCEHVFSYQVPCPRYRNCEETILVTCMNEETDCDNKFVLVAKLTVETESFPVLWEKYGSLTP